MTTEKTWIASCASHATIGIGAADGVFRVVDLEHGQLVGSFATGEFITRACWTADRRHLLVALYDGRVQIRSGDGQVLHKTLETGHGIIRGLALHPSDTRFVVCGDDGLATVWTLDGTRLQSTPRIVDDLRSPIPATACAFFAECIVVGYQSGFFEAFTESTLQNVGGGKVLLRGVAALATTVSGDRLLLGGAAGSMLCMSREWRVEQSWKNTPPKPIAVNAIACRGDATDPFVAAYSDGSAECFDSTESSFGRARGSAFYLRSPKPTWERAMIVSGACWIGTSSAFATSHFDGAVRIWYGYYSATLTFHNNGMDVAVGTTTLTTPAAIAAWWCDVINTPARRSETAADE